jgi:hypothetical protein
MATYNKYNVFVADVSNKQHNLASDQLEVALTNTAPAATDSTLNGEISYTNLSSRNITTTSSTQSGGTYKLLLANLTLISSSGNVAAFRYIAIRNKTSNKLIAWVDYGSSVTLNGGNGDIFNVNFDQTNGLLELA